MKKDESAYIDPNELIDDTEFNDQKKHNTSIDSMQITAQDEFLNHLELKNNKETLKSKSLLPPIALGINGRRSKQSKSLSQQQISELPSPNGHKKDNYRSSLCKGKSIADQILLFVNVKTFIKKLTQNCRISNKLTLAQYQAIGDISSTYGVKPNSKKKIKLNVKSIIIKNYIKKIPLISPYSLFKRLWDSVQVSLILVLFYFISLSLFFELEIFTELLHFYKLCLLFFIMDTFVTLNTGVILKGSVNFQRKVITKNYFRQYLLQDMFGNISLFIFVTQSNFQQSYYKIIQLLVIMKWVKLRDIFIRLNFYLCYERNQKNMVDLIRLLFLIICVCHVFCSFWHGLALYEIRIGQKNTWLHHLDLVESPIMERYAYSFYYLSVTMITVGYGDITPQNPLEIVFTIMTMFVTGIVYAFSLNTIGTIIDNIEKKDKNYKENMQVIHGLMREENISRSLRIKISNYLEYLYKESNEILKLQQKQIIEKLSSQLQRDFILEVRGRYLLDIPFFNSMNEKNQIILEMEEILFSPGEYIFQQDNMDDCSLYYIVKGSVQLIHNKRDNQETILSTKEKQQYFGELSFITGFNRTISARANDFCRIYKIQRQKFLELIKSNDHDFENFLMLKEVVIHKNNYTYGQIKCFTCNSTNHYCIDCPKTHLILTKSSVYSRFNYSHSMELREKEGRQQRKKFKSIQKIQSCAEGVFLINDKEEYFDILDEIERGWNVSERIYTSDYADDYLECIAEEDEFEQGVSILSQKQFQKIKSTQSGTSPTHKQSNRLFPARQSQDLSQQWNSHQFTNQSSLQDFDRQNLFNQSKDFSKISKEKNKLQREFSKFSKEFLKFSKEFQNQSQIISSQSPSLSSSSSSSSDSQSPTETKSTTNKKYDKLDSFNENNESSNKFNSSIIPHMKLKNEIQEQQIHNFNFNKQQSNFNSSDNSKTNPQTQILSDNRIKTFKTFTEGLDGDNSEFNAFIQAINTTGVIDNMNNSVLIDQNSVNINKKIENDSENKFKVSSISSIGSNQYQRIPSRFFQQEKFLLSQFSLSDQQKNKEGLQNLSSNNQDTHDMSILSNKVYNRLESNIQNKFERQGSMKKKLSYIPRKQSVLSQQGRRISSRFKRSVQSQEQLQQSIGLFINNLKQQNPKQYYAYQNGGEHEKKTKSIKPSYFSQKNPSLQSLGSQQNGFQQLSDSSKLIDKQNYSIRFEERSNNDISSFQFIFEFDLVHSFKYYFPHFNFTSVIERWQKYQNKKIKLKKQNNKKLLQSKVKALKLIIH